LYDTAFDESPRDIRQARHRVYYDFNDIAHHLGEFIELYNYTTEDISLKGWVIYDNAGKFHFPNNAVIKSESFLILAYRNLKDKPDIGNYFPVFFPTARGKEAQIIYQDQIILNNKKESLSLKTYNLAEFVFQHPVEIASMRWDNTKKMSQSNAEMDKSYTSLNNRNFYTNSRQKVSANTYAEIPATPFTSAYLPKTQALINIPRVQEILEEYVGLINWDRYVKDVLLQKCDLNITIVQQSPKGKFNKEELCFVYDASGNYLRTEICSNTAKRNLLAIDEVKDINTQEIVLGEIKNSVIVYPNPTSGIVNVNIKDDALGQIIGFDIFNANGALILSKDVNPKEGDFSCDITPYASGIYMMRFKLSSGDSFSTNIVKR